MVHENVKKLMDGFRYDAHPMGMLMSTVAALSTFYPEAKNVRDPQIRAQPDLPPDRQDAHPGRLRLPPLASGLPYIYPDNDLSYCGNFLQHDVQGTEASYEVNPVLERALDVLFILHADHEQNCSTSAMRGVGSSEVDPYSATAGGHRRPLRPAPRRRQRGGAAHAPARSAPRTRSRPSSRK